MNMENNSNSKNNDSWFSVIKSSLKYTAGVISSPQLLGKTLKATASSVVALGSAFLSLAPLLVARGPLIVPGLAAVGAIGYFVTKPMFELSGRHWSEVAKKSREISNKASGTAPKKSFDIKPKTPTKGAGKDGFNPNAKPEATHANDDMQQKKQAFDLLNKLRMKP